jgi:hypothetical protein
MGRWSPGGGVGALRFASVCGPGNGARNTWCGRRVLRVGHSADPVSQGSAKLGQEDIGPLKVFCSTLADGASARIAGAYLTTSGEVVLLIPIQVKACRVSARLALRTHRKLVRDPRKLSCSVRLSAIRTQRER